MTRVLWEAITVLDWCTTLFLIVRVFKTYQVLRHNGLSVTPELLRIVLHSGKHLGKRYFTLYACPRKEYYCPRHYLELLKGNIFDHLHWFICACDNVFLGKWNTVKSIIRTFTYIADASLGHTKSVEHSLCTTSTDAENFLCLDAFRHLIFCAQMHARGRTHTHARLFSCPPCPSCCLDLESLSPPILVPSW